MWTPEPDQLRTCLRCRAYRQYVHHPERLMFPQKRVGEKGEGKFERISWDEALDTLADRLKSVKEKYGNGSIFLATGGAYLASLHNGGLAAARLLNQFGGYVTHYGILWGWDPARMISGTNTMYHLIRAKENGAKVISVDPRYHDTAAVLAHEWIPIRPGTDTAVMVAMANVMIRDNLHDQAFLDRYTVGFDRFADYVLGREDGVEKTPAWAAEISGVGASVIERLAREYATTKPAALMDCQGPARSAMGEQYNRCAATLCAMTGNVGRPGGSACGGLMGIPIGHMFRMPAIPPGKNPFELEGPKVKGTLDIRLRVIKRIHINRIFDAILKGKAGGYPSDIRMMWSMCNNYLNQTGNSNKAARALKQLPFLAVNEIFMTSQARYADLLLPVTTAAERSDLTRPWPSGPYFTFVNRALEPLGECKSDLEICGLLAERLGIEDFNPFVEDEILKVFVEKTPDMASRIKDFETTPLTPPRGRSRSTPSGWRTSKTPSARPSPSTCPRRRIGTIPSWKNTRFNSSPPTREIGSTRSSTRWNGCAKRSLTACGSTQKTQPRAGSRTGTRSTCSTIGARWPSRPGSPRGSSQGWCASSKGRGTTRTKTGSTEGGAPTP
ncbi:MAG: molybdopterin-dependent oxidoreductase [Deltaproteobacteria bacterium]|nr:molybdopterin-dependent oxidoreductase [Deltaproteobacteria bacterium]